ncbi:MAG: hypothetical protein BZY88_03535 [SAR202 cluster bacterium Io17-Chloro-G9]|nr:MAG: hypothetical protein BZY88_03535 [SAR202 cluster bacterium Io17-Chloro-G9]
MTSPKNAPENSQPNSEEEGIAGAEAPEETPAEDAPAEDTPAPRNLEWMEQTLEWGTRALPGKHGLTMQNINVGIYGEVPERSTVMNRMPRGAYPVPGSPRLELYAVNEKAELWSDNAADLYEEAIQRRWMVHVDVPWDTITPLPEDVELAMCQLCTELSQQAAIEIDVLGQWLHRMNNIYTEVKTFLASELFDAARDFDVFRRRALINGGALGLESPGQINRRLLESRAGWTETALLLYILRGTFTLLLCRYGEAYAHNPAEKYMFRRCMEDKARHIAYGMSHLKYACDEKGEDYALGLSRVMRGSEGDLAREMKDPVLWEAMAIVFGGGVRHMTEGMETVKVLQKQYIEQYLARMRWIGVDKNIENMAPELAAFLGVEETTPAGG